MPIKYIVKHPKVFMDWMFEIGKGTRVIEMLNTLLLLGFTIPFLYSFSDLMEISIYRNFYLAESTFWWLGMAILGIVQWVAMVKKGCKANQFSGFILMVSAWVWGMIALTFIISVPPLTPAPFVYSIISILCGLAGLHLLNHNKRAEDILKGD